MSISPLNNQGFTNFSDSARAVRQEVLQEQGKLLGLAQFILFKIREPLYFAPLMGERAVEIQVPNAETQHAFLSIDDSSSQTSVDSSSVESGELRMESPEPIKPPLSLLDRAKQVKLTQGGLASTNLRSLWKEHSNVYEAIINTRQGVSARQASRNLLEKIIGAPVKDKGYKTLTFLMQTAVEHQTRGMPDRQRYITMIEKLLEKGKTR